MEFASEASVLCESLCVGECVYVCVSSVVLTSENKHIHNCDRTKHVQLAKYQVQGDSAANYPPLPLHI